MTNYDQIEYNGTSVIFNYFKNSELNLDRVFNILKEQKFQIKLKFGIQDIEKIDDCIQFRYLEIFAKNYELFEGENVVIKTLYFPKYSGVILFEDHSIFIGSTSLANRVKNKIKGLINIEFLPLFLNKKRMLEIYNDFFKVFQLNLVEEEEEAYIQNFRIKGDLSDISYWEEFSSKNRYLSEIYGQFEINDLVYNLKILSNCKCQIFKSGDFFPKENLMWLKNYLIY